MADFDNTIVARFWSKVDKNGPVPSHMPHLGQCWAWTGFLGPAPRAYGSFIYAANSKSRWRAHRYAWAATYGPIPAGLFVLHRCDNPTCVNPSHLWVGTQADNVADMISKGRGGSGSGRRFGPRDAASILKGEAHPHAKLTEEDVREIRASRAAGIPGILLAKRFQVPRNYIYMIANRRAWRHLP